MLLPDTSGTGDFGHVKSSKASEGVTAGATTGGVAGGALGLLAGIGALAIPGVGPFIAAGPIMAALSGAALGATTGGIVGGLIGLGIPEIKPSGTMKSSARAITSSPLMETTATNWIARRRSSRLKAPRTSIR